MFQHLQAYAGDPILSLVETFNRDPREHKVNLSIGIYFDDAGCLPLPEAVRAAQTQQPVQAQPYLPMEGHAAFRAAALRVLLGNEHPVLQQNRAVAVQTLGGSGALKLAADFLKRWYPQSRAFVSDPTWDNHRGILEGAGIEVGTYPYYDPKTIGVRFAELTQFLHTLDSGDIVLLHPCCHNPTGVDLSPEQWDEVLHIIQSRRLIALMDIAYQGFGDDFDRDAYAVRKAADMGLSFFVSSSYSKNMSLYGERVGILAAVCPNAEQAERVLGQLKFGVRRIYSSPPFHGADIAARVLNESSLHRQWQNEVYAMRDRIKHMRRQLHDALSQRLPQHDFSHYVTQRGMFGYTGLNERQVQRLQDEFAVYLLKSGRLCMAGLNSRNIEYVAHAIATVMQESETPS